MDFLKAESHVEEALSDIAGQEAMQRSLADVQLALLGGGCGEVIFG